MVESKLEGEIIVKDLDLFLEKSKQGINLVYQLHRQLGAIFIDASFQDKESPSLLYKVRVHLDPPKLVHTEIQWDEHGFPYELEVYDTPDGEIKIPLYRSGQGRAMSQFLIDVAEYEAQDSFESMPYRNECLHIIDLITKVSKTLEEIQDEADDKELRAIDTYFGEAGIFDLLGDSASEAIARYLGDIIWNSGKGYEEVREAAQEKRQRALVEVENRAIKRLEDMLETCNFKQGFVSTEVVV